MTTSIRLLTRRDVEQQLSRPRESTDEEMGICPIIELVELCELLKKGKLKLDRDSLRLGMQVMQEEQAVFIVALDQERLARLELGMSKSDVQTLLCTSLLQDSFHPDRWDYFFSIRKARKKDTEKKLLTLYFKDGKLNQIVGTVTSADDTETGSQTKTVIIDEKPAQGGIIQRGWDSIWK